MATPQAHLKGNDGLNHYYSFILALLFALAAGLVGSFAFMKRMVLASDVISHLALPGLGVAFLLHVNPLAGGAASLFLGAFLIWWLQGRTGLSLDSMIGIVFACALALGAAITPNEDLLEALLGGFQEPSLLGLLLGVLAAAIVVMGILRLKDQMILGLFSSDLAIATGVNIRREDLFFLLLFSLTVLIGLRFTGALLGSALIIVPAATARQLATNVASFVTISCSVSILAVSVGWLCNSLFVGASTPGPTIVIVSAILFASSLLKRH